MKKKIAGRGFARRGFFRLGWGILILSVIIYALNLILILQLSPVFEKQDYFSRVINLIIFPANFLLEDIFEMGGVGTIVLSWVLEFFYAYIIACIVRRMMRVRVRI